jgi:hypothetical protein
MPRVVGGSSELKTYTPVKARSRPGSSKAKVGKGATGGKVAEGDIDAECKK